MSEEVFDGMLQSTGQFHAGVFTYQQNRPPEEDFSLGHEFWVGSLLNGVRSDLVFDPLRLSRLQLPSCPSVQDALRFLPKGSARSNQLLRLGQPKCGSVAPYSSGA
jgi:hypothetical protein